MRRSFIAALVSFGLLTAAGIGSFAQTTGSTNPPLVIHSLAGQDLFLFYCASCHGRQGGGDGPVAAALTTTPTDLRLLAKHNGGIFPRTRVERLVANDGSLRTPAHGSSEMPVWGPIFRGLDASEAMAAIRIANLVEYLESIQTR